MKFKKSILFGAFLSVSAINFTTKTADINPAPALTQTSWFSMPEWLTPCTQEISFAQVRDTGAMYLGYVTALVIAEQLCETGIHYYNKSYADHAKKFKEALKTTALNKKDTAISYADEDKLRTLAWEFRNPLYRYTFGFFIKNRIQTWLETQIEMKKNYIHHVVSDQDLESQLRLGSY